MSNPIWPRHLPSALVGSSFSPVDPQLRTRMQSGREFVRPNFTSVPVNFSARWFFTDGQAERFESFYKVDLADGTKWFELPVRQPSGFSPRLAQFRGAYTYRRISPDRWEFQAEMALFLRDVD